MIAGAVLAVTSVTVLFPAVNQNRSASPDLCRETNGLGTSVSMADVA
jgi:hypothetical protein